MSPSPSPSHPRIEDHALIGDCETAALVARDGTVDWLCWPRFDSSACFAALLGGPDHGRWRIAPEDPAAHVTRGYRPGTLILETEFRTAEGVATLVDFMPLRHEGSHLVRMVFGRSGRVAMRTEFAPRFEYGCLLPWMSGLPDGRLRSVAGADMAVLDSPVPLDGDNGGRTGRFNVGAGDCAAFVLSHGPSHLDPPRSQDPHAALRETDRFWTEWSGRCRYAGPWAEAVLRSHIVLKALTYAPTGGIVAAPTTSLPEQLGGTRNWDYRYCWLRDATFTLLSLLRAGYREEARAWRDWLLRAVAGSPAQVQIMYRVDGARRIPEWEAGWLTGHAGSLPVRIGNAAVDQLQLDVFGEVMDTLDQSRRAGLEPNEAAWSLQRGLVEYLETIWDRPDRGIWEMRGPHRHFTHSKVMAWVALDRAVRAVEGLGLLGPADRWRALRRTLHEEVCRRGFDPELGSFVQAYGSQQLDASLLMLPLVGFLPANDERVRGTVAAIERRLLRDGFVVRYDTSAADDGLPPGEGAFLACSFWLADNLVLQGRRADAQALFERLLSVRNDVGLLAEEYDPLRQRQLGNFPQAFSHVALADTARNLTEASGPADSRGRS